MLSAAAFFLFSLLVRPERGVVAETIAELRLRIRIVREHIAARAVRNERATTCRSARSFPNRK